MSDGLVRARADLAAGRVWKARNRLNGVLANRQDHEVLDLLATVHYEMHDLPAAGALWFVVGRDDDVAQRSISAWSEQHPKAVGRWHSIPAPIRRNGGTDRLEDLRRAAGQAGNSGTRGPALQGAPEAWWEPIVFGAGPVVVVVCFLAMAVIGMCTVFGWIWG